MSLKGWLRTGTLAKETVQCPICEQDVKSESLNDHLDSEHLTNVQVVSIEGAKNEDFPQSEQVKCPVCQACVPHESINKHLDEEHVNGPPISSSENSKRRRFVPSGPPFLFAKRLKQEENPLVTLKYDHGERTIAVSKLPGECPCEIVCNILPPVEADQLLGDMLEQAKETWETTTWTVYNNVSGRTNRRSKIYQLEPNKTRANKTVGGSRSRTVCPESLVNAGEYIKQLVKQKASEMGKNGGKFMNTEDARASKTWRPTFVLANYYENGEDHLGFHGDSLTRLGKRPIVAMISLGATRYFRWKENGKQGTYTARLPHNSALVMFPPMQECWQHGVPKIANSKIIPYPISGIARISLTFRMLKHSVSDWAPSCECGRVASLKYSQKSKRYFFKCNPQGVGNCNFFQWSD